MVQARLFNINDYPIVSSWWTARSWPVLPLDLLPKTGVVVGDYCAGFLYSTDSRICWIEFIVSNPNTDKAERDRAMNLLLDRLIVEAKNLGCKVIFTSAKNEHLERRLKSKQFQQTDSQVNHYLFFMGGSL